jgi:hypothetical protein
MAFPAGSTHDRGESGRLFNEKLHDEDSITRAPFLHAPVQARQADPLAATEHFRLYPSATPPGKENPQPWIPSTN